MMAMRLAISSIITLLFFSAANAEGYRISQGKGYAICEAVKKQLNRRGPAECNWQIIHETLGLKEVGWQDIDIQTHWDLFVRLNRHELRPENEVEFQKLLASWREQAKVGDVKLQIFRAKIVAADDAPETITRVWRKNGCAHQTDDAYIDFVTPNLTDVDIRADKPSIYWLPPRGDLFYYGRRYYVLNLNDSDVIISTDFGNGFIPFCAITFDQ